MFIKYNNVNGNRYALLVESYRPNYGSSPRHRVISYLGAINGHKTFSQKTRTFEPMRPSFLEEIPKDLKNFAVEKKEDGTRIIGYFNKKGQALINRRNANKTEIYPELRDIYKKLRFKDGVVLDGEIVALKGGKSDFKALSERDRLKDKILIYKRSKTHPLEYHVFDVLHKDGKDATNLPIEERKKLLDKIVPDYLKTIKEIRSGNFKQLLVEAKRKKEEGLILKRKGSKYEEGKVSRDWQKLKLLKENDITAIGFQEGTGKRKDHFGSILMGVWDKDGWRYVGRVGTGFNDQELNRLTGKMNRLKSNESPKLNNNIPESEKKRTIWIKPKIVMRVKFLQLTKDGKYREPAYISERSDIKSQDTHLSKIKSFKLPPKSLSSFRSKFIEVEKKGRIINTRKPEEVLDIAKEIERRLKPLSSKILLAGSIRRKRPATDVDFVIIPKDKEKIKTILSENGEIIASGNKKVSSIINGVRVDIFFTEPNSWGASLLAKTGPVGGALGNRSLARNKGMILNEYGLFKRTKEGKPGRYIVGRTEREIYNALGKPYRPPEQRGLPR